MVKILKLKGQYETLILLILKIQLKRNILLITDIVRIKLDYFQI